MNLQLAILATLLTGCVSVVQSNDPTPEEKIKKLEVDKGIVERALKRCKAKLPPDGGWPNIYSIGSFGNLWVTRDMHGYVFALKRHFSDHEEQMFIVPRSSRSDIVEFEGTGLRKISSDTIYSIFAYIPPEEDQERLKLQKISISIDGTKFVFLFQPTKY